MAQASHFHCYSYIQVSLVLSVGMRIQAAVQTSICYLVDILLGFMTRGQPGATRFEFLGGNTCGRNTLVAQMSNEFS